MMKNNLILLIVFVTTILVGCKPKNIDIDNTLKQISEETFAQTSTRSGLAVKGNDMCVVDYVFNTENQTVARKEVRLVQKAAYVGVQQEEFTYTWGEFADKMYGRSLLLTGINGNRDLVYLNNHVNDGEVVTTTNEPLVEVAANMIQGLTSGKWYSADSAIVKELIWVDTMIITSHLVGKKIIWDTTYMRMPRPNAYINRGIDSCLYYTYNFECGTTSKEASFLLEFKKNIVVADTTILPQKQDLSKNDTIITYQVTDCPKTVRRDVKYAYWYLSKIEVKKSAQSMDVVVGETDKNPETLAISAFLFDGTKGSFVLNELNYNLVPKN